MPCFLYVFAGGPLIEKSHGSEVVSQILKLVTAAVVGVILNLTLFLGKDVVFPGGLAWGHLNVLSLIWIGLSLVLMQRFKLNVVYLILLSLGVGLVRFVLKVQGSA
ncbi:chromate transporter [Mucilaginibacter sp. 22184]|uniref:chromate transporter n=1 Tax=Mucilaginibacter sp. 22184 TaxID=3453887 RepID=UPI003F8556AF